MAIVIVSIFLIYQSGVPLIRKMQGTAAIERMKSSFADLDEIIQQTAAEGKGSKRTLQLNVDPGKIIINSTEDSIYWELETDSGGISPRTSQRYGNVVVGTNMDTRCYEENYTYSVPETECYVIENEHLKAYFKKIGSLSSPQDLNTSDILVAVFNKDSGQWLNNTGFLDVSVDFNETSKTGTGYTMLLESGYNLPYGTVYSYVNSTYIDYYINFTLESGADFIGIEASL